MGRRMMIRSVQSQLVIEHVVIKVIHICVTNANSPRSLYSLIVL